MDRHANHGFGKKRLAEPEAYGEIEPGACNGAQSLERRQGRIDRREQSRNAELTLEVASIHGTDLRKAVREYTFGSRGQSPRNSPADA